MQSRSDIQSNANVWQNSVPWKKVSFKQTISISFISWLKKIHSMRAHMGGGCWLGSPGPIELIASRRLAIPAPPAQERSS